MNIRKTLLSGLFATSIALGGTAALSQESTPSPVSGDASATPVAPLTNLEGIAIYDAEGNSVGQLSAWEDEDGGGVWFSLSNGEATSLEEGKYGVHVHETGVCDPADAFGSAGGHFNPTDEQHGDVNADPSHGGDLGNLEVDGDGSFEHEVLAEKLSLTPGEQNSLADEDGSALMIHAGEDDLETDPSGESGDRWACAVILPPMDGAATPVTTDQASPVATPAG